jgi:hypothetical protein
LKKTNVMLSFQSFAYHDYSPSISISSLKRLMVSKTSQPSQATDARWQSASSSPSATNVLAQPDMASARTSLTIPPKSIWGLSSDQDSQAPDVFLIVLEHLPPREMWALRAVSRTWKLYIEQVLVHTHILPNLSIYLRSSESYAFLPPTENSARGDPNYAQPGQGVRFDYTSSCETEETAFLNLAHGSLPYRLELTQRIQFHVQVMVCFGGKWFRHIRIPSLSMDIENLELSIDWREVLNTVLVMPDHVRKRMDRKLQPATWVWHAMGEGEWGSEWLEYSKYRKLPNAQFCIPKNQRRNNKTQ